MYQIIKTYFNFMRKLWYVHHLRTLAFICVWTCLFVEDKSLINVGNVRATILGHFSAPTLS